MSHEQLRTEKNCLNCRHTVEERYCGVCGQENIQPRQTFIHLVSHIFEDLTHYEGKVWASLRLLFFKPGFLSKEYLEGKRATYFPPVRFYIFVSFITFFLPGMIPETPNVKTEKKQIRMELDSVDRKRKNNDLAYDSHKGLMLPTRFESMKELDSTRDANKGSDSAIGYWNYRFHEKAIELNGKHSTYDMWGKFTESMAHNFPKALFIYMPLFALLLRLFHKRKNWIYFDHSIFTLHYFSFMLLTFLLLILCSDIVGWLVYAVPVIETIVSIFLALLYFFGLLSFPFYLFKAHIRMYGETAGISFLKTSGILLLNLVLFSAVFLILVLYTLFTMH